MILTHDRRNSMTILKLVLLISSYYLVIPGRLLETYEQFLLFLLLKHLRSALIFPSYWIPKRSRFQPCLNIWPWKMFRFQPCLDFWPIVSYRITKRSRFQPCLDFWSTKWPRFQPCLDFWFIVLNIKPGILVMACLWRNVLMLLNSSKDKVEKILKDRLDSIPSPSPSVKIQIML